MQRNQRCVGRRSWTLQGCAGRGRRTLVQGSGSTHRPLSRLRPRHRPRQQQLTSRRRVATEARAPPTKRPCIAACLVDVRENSVPVSVTRAAHPRRGRDMPARGAAPLEAPSTFRPAAGHRRDAGFIGVRRAATFEGGKSARRGARRDAEGPSHRRCPPDRASPAARYARANPLSIESDARASRCRRCIANAVRRSAGSLRVAPAVKRSRHFGAFSAVSFSARWRTSNGS